MPIQQTDVRSRLSAHLRRRTDCWHLDFLGSSMRLDNTVVGRAADRTANLAAHPVLFGVTDISFAVISTISGGMTLVSSELDEPFIAVD